MYLPTIITMFYFRLRSKGRIYSLYLLRKLDMSKKSVTEQETIIQIYKNNNKITHQ